MLTEPILQTFGLRRELDGRVALDDVSIRIDPGRIVAVLGPNGAGRTTTVRMCVTLLTPTAGTVRVDGVDAVVSMKGARRRTSLDRGAWQRWR